MKYRKIENTDMEISAITLGSWVFGGDCWGEVKDSESVRVVQDAIEKGINFIDTAPIYGSGRSEEIIGRALQHKPGRVMIATKCGLQQKGSSIRPNLSAPFIREEVDASLRRLGVETIDLYQCHWPDPNTSLEETFGELKRLAEEGKIRHIGVSNFGRDLLRRALLVAPIVSNQVQYSLFDRAPEEDLIPFCKEKGISVLSYGSLGGGILTGKYKEPPAFPKGDVRAFFYQYYREPFWSKAKGLVSVLEGIAGKHKVPASHVAINWVLTSREVASCIVGCRTPEQLEQNVKAADWELTEDELTKIQAEYDRIFSKPFPSE
ncbi:aldo/keto reductase [Candidatus Omnitrophota bacterium]